MDHRVPRQILVGVLAVQKELVSESALLDAFRLWVRERHRGLADLLISLGTLGHAERDLLSRLTEQHLRESGNDPDAALQNLGEFAGIRVRLLELADTDAHATVMQPEETPADAPPDSRVTTFDSTAAEKAGGRFVVIKPLAHGGLGSVSIARDLELNRQIALKEILEEHADNLDSQVRFKREAEITGGLEHPGIVPVYGLGVYANGRPFYAMRLIRGDSLKEALARFHAARQSGGSGFDSLEFRSLLRRMIDVCNAIQYAHDRRVLHRDLKPGNIMLGQYGETLVVDWGLAKPLAEKASPASPELTGTPIPPLVPRTSLTDSGSTETQTGEVKGTPAYMSPEQARGEWETLGAATDVYALGATLYSVLTGKPPVEAGSGIAALKLAAGGEIRRARELVAAVPRSLDAVCHQAMAYRPQDRYASARELAADLERWLADEPVTAARETTTERLSRVTRKHRTAALTALAASVLLAVLSTAAALVISGLRDAEQIAREAAETLATEKTQLAEQKAAQTRIAVAAQQFAVEQQTAAEREATAAKAAQAETARQLQRVEYLLYSSNIREADQAWQEGHGDAAWDILASTRFDMRAWEYDELAAQHIHASRLRLFTGGYGGAAFSPDGSILCVNGGGDPAVRVFDTRSGQLIRTLPSRIRALADSAFSARGDVFVTGAPNGEFRRWNVTTGEMIDRVQFSMKPVFCFALHPEGRMVAIGAEDQTVRLMDLISGNEVRSFSGHTGTIGLIDFSRDGEWIAGGNHGGELSLWNARTGSLAHRHETHMQVLSIGFSADSKTVAAGWLDGTITQFDVATGRLKRKLTAGNMGVRAFAFSPRGDLLAAAGEGGTIQLWTESGRMNGKLKGHHSGVTELKFSSDGGTLASSSADLTVRLWRIPAEDKPDALIRYDGSVTDLRIVREDSFVSASTDGIVHRTHLVSGDSDRTKLKGVALNPALVLDAAGARAAGHSNYQSTTHLWDARTGEHLRDFAGGPSFAAADCFSPQGDRLASAERDGTIRVWNIDSGDALWVSPRQETVLDLAFSPTEDLIASSHQNSVRLWNATSGELLKTLAGHGVGPTRLTFSADGKQIACGVTDQSVCIWNVASGELTHTLRGNVGAVLRLAFSPDARSLVSCSHQGRVSLWNLETGQAVRTLNDVSTIREADFANVLRVGSDGTVIAGCADGTVRVWDAAAAPAVRTLRSPEAEMRSLGVGRNGELWGVSSDGWVRTWNMATGSITHSARFSQYPNVIAAASSDGSRFFTSHSDNSVQIWDRFRNGPAAIADQQSGINLELVCSADGQMLAGASSGGVNVWESNTGRHLRMLPHPNARSVALAPDGQWIAAGGAPIQVWNLQTGTPHHMIEADSASGCQQFSPDSRILAAGYDDGSIRLWNTNTGRQIQKLGAHQSPVSRLACSPDGKWLASSGSSDGQICLWNLATNELELVLNTDGGFIALGFSPDSSLLCSGGGRGRVHLWPLEKIASQLAALLERFRLKAAAGNLPAARRHLEQLVSLGYWSPKIEAGFRELDAAEAPPPSRRKRPSPGDAPPPDTLPDSVKQYELSYANLRGAIVTQSPQQGAPARISDWKQRPLSLQSRGAELIAILSKEIWQVEGPQAPGELFKTDAPWRHATWDFGTRQVAFARGASGEVPHIFIQAEGQEPRDLGPGYDPAFGPDGKLVCLLWKGNRFQIVVVDGQTELRIAAPLSPQLTVYPVLSPDGREIAFSMAGKDGTRQIGLVDADPRAKAEQVTNHGPRPASLPSYSPDGRFLAYLVGSPPQLELRVLDLETNADVAVASDAAFVRPIWRARADGD